MRKDKWVRVRVSSRLADTIANEAAEMQMSVSEYVRFILQSWVYTVTDKHRLVDTPETYEVTNATTE